VGHARSYKDKTDAAGTLAEVASHHRSPDTIESALVVAREMLDMDVSFISEFAGEQMVFRKLSGETASFGWREGEGVPLARTFCKQVIEDRLRSVVPDAKDDECAKSLDITDEAAIGSYVGVPLRFSDGRLYGTLCSMSHSPNPSLRERDADFLHVLARLIADQLEREDLESKNRQLQLKATAGSALLAALEARDGYTGEHSRSVAALSVAVARLIGLSEEKVEDVAQAAQLHDIGKLGVPDAILNKQGPLDDGEWEVIREHPLMAERIVSSIEGLGHLAPVVRAEHERWDGKGYPDGLSSEQIPLASRIVFACDAFHAITSDRPYRKAMGIGEALRELEKGSGTQFDRRVVDALVGAVGGTHL